MKKNVFLIFVICSLTISLKDAFSFSDVGTHPTITEKAILQSFLADDYLTNNLGFKKGLLEIISDKTIMTLLTNGAKTEDSGIENPPDSLLCDRGLNHFFDPTGSYPFRGLYERVFGYQILMNMNPALLFLFPEPVLFLDYLFEGKENPLWGIGPDYDYDTPIDAEPTEAEQESSDRNQYSWTRGREAYIAALTAKDGTKRNNLFARTFRSLGQVVHVLQDMAVPAHVRNDMRGHLYFQKYLIQKYGLKNKYSPHKWIGNTFET